MSLPRRLERRNIEDSVRFLEIASSGLTDQAIDADEEGCRVFPDPVGAEIIGCCSGKMWGQPCSWGSVGVAILPMNQSLDERVSPAERT